MFGDAIFEAKSKTTKKWQKKIKKYKKNKILKQRKINPSIKMENLPSSTHMRPSSISFSPVGQAHDILGLRSVIFGAGKHKCEQ